ncbi:MAG: hypothetical protein AB7S77_16795 [Desulfatirhabdiaceae bacterium]|jgi:hypothetical protein
MKTKKRSASLEDHIGCMGDFRIEDEVCRKLCAFSIRCAIECNYHIQSEIFDEMMSPESIGATLQ